MLLTLAFTTARADDPVFPGVTWTERDPLAVGCSPAVLDRLADELGGRGCVIRQGYLVRSWGDVSRRADWYSAVKPVFSTLLFFAIQEGRVPGVDAPIADFGWPLQGKDRGITFRHLADMTSGYARPEAPGAAWAYNDYAIQLYQQTLFDRVFRDDPTAVLLHPDRLGTLAFQDAPAFDARRRLHASVRDVARIAWFWANQGRWADRQLLPTQVFQLHMRPDVPVDLPLTTRADTRDSLRIDSFGGGSDHFTRHGPGIYGFNWWFNAIGPADADRPTWPAAPADTVLAIGFGGNVAALMPSLDLVVVSASGDWGPLQPGDPDSKMNLRLGRIRQIVTDPPDTGP